MAADNNTTAKVTIINSASEFDALLAANTYAVIDFHATWCGPCKAMSPLFDQHAAQHAREGRVAFAKVDIDAVPDVAARYRITTIPTFLFVKEGEAYEDVRTASPPKLKGAVEDVVRELAKEEEKAAGGTGGADENQVAAALKDEDW
ncbi:thioredoxin-domain-containing protein [Apiospora arundinis]|uniref:Thioredoxin-domain-containing protein n=1 Tax=Apiospora arundinis TaxID=335852 RepID=A0ABR2I621_9PEZI